MSHGFSSQSQQRLFQGVLRRLGDIGYQNSLLVEHYNFADHFAASNTLRQAPAVAFGQLPHDPNTACFAVVLATSGVAGAELINDYRALGAPLAFEVRDDCVAQWRVTTSVSESDCQEISSPDNLQRLFDRNRDKWSPHGLMRAKNIAPTGPKQLDFIDAGLIPALENHVKEKLDPLLREILHAATKDYRKRHKSNPDSDALFRLLFRSISGKVMHDRGLEPFSDINAPDEPERFLKEVARHYNDSQPIIDDAATQSLVTAMLWSGMGFAHLSIDILAFVWENTLVTDDIRRERGIHATPPNVARFVARTLIDEPPPNDRFVVEPCCGSGTFLVAALQQIRELLPPDPDLPSRHRYFANILRGFDTEQFGLDVAQACLTLADFPNRNGWYLKDEDVFESSIKASRFIFSLKNARFILCNPPFKDFSEEERAAYGASYARPAELVNRVLALCPEDAEIGFVFPQKIIDGQAYSAVRRLIAERFASLRVVPLPEGVFEKSRVPTALLVAREPTTHSRTQLSFSYVSDAEAFVKWGIVDRTTEHKRSPQELEISLSVPELSEVWDFLSTAPRLKAAVDDSARGVEWTSNQSGHILDQPHRGTLPGFHTSEELRCFEPPPLSFLIAKDKLYKAWERPWHLSKVVCNAVRKRQVGPWKIAACPVGLNLVCTQNFAVFWPNQDWTARSLAAVLNGPVACAFMACHQSWKHLTLKRYREIPIPSLNSADKITLDALVEKYEITATLKRDGELEASTADHELIDLLREIDSIVLRGYKLPDSLAAELLSLFADYSRPASVQYDVADLRNYEPKGSTLGLDAETLWKVFQTSLREDRA